MDTCAAEFEAYTPYYYSTYDCGDDEVKGNTAKKVMILGEELRSETTPGEGNLTRLDRIYATAKFVSRHVYWMLALGIFVVGALLVMLVMACRSWARRRRERFVQSSSTGSEAEK